MRPTTIYKYDALKSSSHHKMQLYFYWEYIWNRYYKRLLHCDITATFTSSTQVWSIVFLLMYEMLVHVVDCKYICCKSRYRSSDVSRGAPSKVEFGLAALVLSATVQCSMSWSGLSRIEFRLIKESLLSGTGCLRRNIWVTVQRRTVQTWAMRSWRELTMMFTDYHTSN